MAKLTFNVNDDIIYNIAKKSYEKGDYINCLLRCDDLMRKSFTNIMNIYILKADCYTELEEHESAYFYLKKAEKINAKNNSKDDSSITKRLCYTLTSMGKIVPAREYFFRSAKLSPSEIDMEKLMRIVESDELDMIVDDSIELVNKDETFRRLFNDCMNAYSENGLDEGIKKFERLCEKFPDNMDIYNNLALMYLSNGNLKKGVKMARKMQKIDEKSVRGICLILLAYSFSHNENEINKAIESVINDYQINYNDLLPILEQVINLSKYNQAFRLFEKYKAEFNNRYKFLLYYACLNYNIKNNEKAIKTIDKIIKLYGNIGYAKYFKRYFISCGTNHRILTDLNNIPQVIVMQDKEVLSELLSLDKPESAQLFLTDKNYKETLRTAILSDNSKLVSKVISHLTVKAIQEEMEYFLSFISDPKYTSKTMKMTIIFEITKKNIVQKYECYVDYLGNEAEIIIDDKILSLPEYYKNAYYFAFSVFSNHCFDFETKLYEAAIKIYDEDMVKIKNHKDVRALGAIIGYESNLCLTPRLKENLSRMFNCNIDVLHKYFNDFEKEDGLKAREDELLNAQFDSVLNRYSGYDPDFGDDDTF